MCCRAFCNSVAKEGPLASYMDLVMWIPGRVALAVIRDPELSQHLMDIVLKAGLMPASLKPPQAARIWQSLYLECKPQVQACYS